MKMRGIILVLAVALLLSLTGCSGEGMSLTKDERSAVAEYMAKLILKHTRNYEPDLMEEISIKENPSAVKEDFDIAKKEENKDNNKKEAEVVDEATDKDKKQDEKGNVKSLNDIYNLKDFEIIYTGVLRTDKFPKNDGYFSLVAADGTTLYVIQFSIRNKSDKKLNFSAEQDIGYSLTFDNDKYYKPSLTLLENDMQSIDVTIDKNESATSVLVFNISDKEDSSKARLSVNKDGNSYVINVSR